MFDPPTQVERLSINEKSVNVIAIHIHTSAISFLFKFQDFFFQAV
jgi:hypothetical protein